MAKTQRRKPAKKKQPKPPSKDQLDVEMTELASVLDEYRLDNNVDGWFSLPWRDGWNAVQLAYDLWYNTVEEQTVLDVAIVEFLDKTIDQKLGNADTYSRAGEFLTSLSGTGNTLLSAVLRCLQIHISHSSGGGHAYNDVLKQAIRTTVPDHLHEDWVLEWRCRDAIGTTSVLQSDAGDRQRRAFSIAWHRGLFHAAYAIAPVVKP